MIASARQADLKRAWSAWVLNRRAYDLWVSGKSSVISTAQNLKIWTGVLERCDAQRCDPESIIAAYFRDQPNKVPYPQALMSPRILQRCVDLAAAAPARAAEKWRSQDARLRTELQLRGADSPAGLWEAITDPLLPFSVLYRYCVAAFSGFPDFTDSFNAATLAYVTNRPALDVAVGGLIPDQLRFRAVELLGPAPNLADPIGARA
jgi:hypothetical protein